MSNQKDLGWAMRGILSDWLIELQERFRLLPETLFLCLNIIDRFLSARVVSLARLQLVGVTCMFIAAKVEEIICPSAQEFLAQTEASYTLTDVFNAEKYVLKTLDWNVNFANPVHFLRRVSKADDYNVKARTLAKYLLEIACLEWRLIATPPSLLAAAAMWLARISIGNETWTPNLAHYSSYAESALLPTANLMLNYILKPIKHESFYKKYARKRYLKVSVYLRRWALQRWTEGTQVDLAAELPGMKAEIRALRADEELKADQEEAEMFLHAVRIGTHDNPIKYYRELESHTVPEGQVHPHYCPWISSFELLEEKETGKTQTVKFDYEKPLQRGLACATFLVRRRDEGRKRAVVKFVRRYNADAHRFMTNRGLAPALIHYGPQGDCATNLHIVVMDYVVGETLYELYDGDGVLPGGVKSALRDALVQLNDGGFIFPDLSRANVMMTTTDDGDMKGRLRFIEFDWVCERDKGIRHPLHL
ncbi:G2/mitotic-specific cyclin [Marasmius sp. AFHP31]|nr:G2/mitotic-specific cyclin [Marasmius sp. AFHP31]